MLHKKASLLADACVNNEWIPADERDWCVYTIEKWLLLSTFFAVLFVWVLIFGHVLETVCFLVPFYMLRRRIGGFHAKNPSVCLVTSIVIIMIVTLYIGPWMAELAPWALLIICVVVDIFGFLTKPIYPVQAEFSEAETQCNLVRKNYLLAVALLVQTASIALNASMVAAHISIGTLIALLMVVLEGCLRRNLRFGSK